MKLLINILLLFMIISCTKSNNQANNEELNNEKINNIELVGRQFEDRNGLTLKTIKEINFDINSDDKSDAIIIEKIVSFLFAVDSTTQAWDGPGIFNKVSIKLFNGDSLNELNIDGWIKNGPLGYYLEDFNSFNLINSEYITIRQAGKDNIIIFICGYPYASKPGLLTIFNIYKGQPYLIYNSESYLHNFKDCNNDGIKDIVTTIYKKENENKKYNVYILNGGLKLDKKLSEEYAMSRSN